jgi:hypothetical protein
MRPLRVTQARFTRLRFQCRSLRLRLKKAEKLCDALRDFRTVYSELHKRTVAEMARASMPPGISPESDDGVYARWYFEILDRLERILPRERQ